MTNPKDLWSGQFGNDYAIRSPGSVEANAAFFDIALITVPHVASILEFGAGVGNNLRALRGRYPKSTIDACEINTIAFAELQRCPIDGAINCAAQDYPVVSKHELVLTKGFLIHIPPEELQRVYAKLHAAYGKYLLICEYFSVQRTMIPYRGTVDTLWKADFAGELLDRFPDLKLRDYGFVSKRDPVMPQDDLNWWLLERT